MAIPARSESPLFISAEDTYYQIEMQVSAGKIDAAAKLFDQAEQYEIWTLSPLSCSYNDNKAPQEYRKMSLELIKTAAQVQRVALKVLPES